MIQKLKKSSGNAVGFKLNGRVTGTELNAFAVAVDTIIAVQGKIRLLIIVDYPQEFEFKAAWEDLVFWIKHINDIEKLAIVGQKEWEKWLTLLEKPFIHTEVKYYETLNTEDAWSWLKSS